MDVKVDRALPDILFSPPGKDNKFLTGSDTYQVVVVLYELW